MDSARTGVIMQKIKKVPDLTLLSEADDTDYIVGYDIDQGDPDKATVIIPVSNVRGKDVRIIDTISDLQGTEGAYDGQAATLNGFFTTNDGGGGEIVWDATQDKANHNGITIYDPDNTADISSWSTAEQDIWFTAGTGAGCWIRKYKGMASSRWSGTKESSGIDQSRPLQALFDIGGYVDAGNNGYIYVTKARLELLDQFGLVPGTGTTIEFLNGTKILLEPTVDVRHVIVGGAGDDNVHMIRPYIDCNNSIGNGIGCSGVDSWVLDSPRIDNLLGTSYVGNMLAYDEGLGGGRGITFQYNCSNIRINNPYFNNCDIGLDLVGTRNQPSRNMVVTNVTAENCRLPIEIAGNQSEGDIISTYPEALDSSGVVINGFSFHNCGISTPYRIDSRWTRQNSVGNSIPWASPARSDPENSYFGYDWLISDYIGTDTEWDETASYNVNDVVQVTDDGTYGALIGISGGHGITINGIRGTNDPGYGTIGAIIRGNIKGSRFSDIDVYVDTEYLVRFGPVPFLNVLERPFARAEIVTIDGCVNWGTTKYIVESDNPVGFTNDYAARYISIRGVRVLASGVTELVRERIGTTSFAKTCTLEVVNLGLGGIIVGNLSDIYRAGDITEADPRSNYGQEIHHGSLWIKRHQNTQMIQLERTGTSAGTAQIELAGTTVSIGTAKLAISDGAWDGKPALLGSYYIWVDASGRLRIKSGAPTSDTDGTIVGTQS